GMGLLAMGLNTASAAPAPVPMGGVNLASCTIPAAATSSVTSGTGIVATVGGLDFDIVGNQVLAGEGMLSYAGSICNGASSVELKTDNGGATTAGAAPAGFANVIDYSATFDFGTCSSGVPLAAVAAGIGGSTTTACANPESAPLEVSVVVVPTTDPLIKGSYADVLTVTVTP
ncbi:MAG: hypothetical protein KAG26_06190, partial [Methylococcales bacterium]|nr:hypothetical protein [Methylococcales bacterium]